MEKALQEASGSTELDVTVDMSTVSRVCSEDLNEMIRLHLDLKAKGGKLILLGVQVHLMPVFAMTRLDRLIEIRNSAPA